MKFFLLPGCLLLFALLTGGQTQAQKSKPTKEQLEAVQRANTPTALTRTGDLALDMALQDLYAVISGPAGQQRDWDKFRSMFAPNAQMGVLIRNKQGENDYKPLTPEEYITTSGKFLEEKGFFEKEISHRVERYGQLVHVWSTYEARQKETDAKPFMRGINSIQFVLIGHRYRIASLIWQAESEQLPLPAEYLPGK